MPTSVRESHARYHRDVLQIDYGDVLQEDVHAMPLHARDLDAYVWESWTSM